MGQRARHSCESDKAAPSVADDAAVPLAGAFGFGAAGFRAGNTFARLGGCVDSAWACSSVPAWVRL